MIATSQDVCLELFDTTAEAAGVNDLIPPGARVLEIGCAEADWLTPMRTSRPDLHLTGLDWRKCSREGADEIITADVLVYDFPPRSFDAVVLVSTLEHIGLGHYSEDPLDEAGDVKTMRRVWDWLTPGGLVIFDVPWHPDSYRLLGTECRVYDDASLDERAGLAQGWRVRWAGYFDYKGRLQPSRPSQIGAARFYYTARVWQKPA